MTQETTNDNRTGVRRICYVALANPRTFGFEFYLRSLPCVFSSLFQALCECGRLKMRAGDERGLVEKERATSPFHSRIPLAADPAFRPLAFSIVLTDREHGTG